MIRSSLFLAIAADIQKGTVEEVYQLRKLESGWELQKEDGEVYHVQIRKGQVSCDCQDYLNRKEKINGACKHMASIIKEGLL